MSQGPGSGINRALTGVLAVLIPGLMSGTPAAEAPQAAYLSSELDRCSVPCEFPSVVVAQTAPSRVLRGDFEAPSELVVAYERGWEVPITQLAEAARGQAVITLLTRRKDIGRPFVVQLSKRLGVNVLESRLDTPWVRDFGPFEVHDARVGTLWLDFDYSWERPGDDALPRWLSSFTHTPVESSQIMLDGGAVVSNGDGLCAMTSTSLRRSGFSPSATGELPPLFTWLGCSVVAILPELPGERTGHVDLLVQFLAPDLVAVASVDPEQHRVAAARLDEAVRALTVSADLAAVPLRVVRVPIQIDDRTTFSYVNVTRLRTKLLVPGFDAVEQRHERAAYRALRAALPGIELARIGSDQMAARGGAVHCVTLGLGRAKARQRS